MIKNTPPIILMELWVTVLTDVASGKIDSVLIPSAWSSALFITVNWAPVSMVGVRALECPAPGLFVSSGVLTFSSVYAFLSRARDT